MNNQEIFTLKKSSHEILVGRKNNRYYYVTNCEDISAYASDCTQYSEELAEEALTKYLNDNKFRLPVLNVPMWELTLVRSEHSSPEEIFQVLQDLLSIPIGEAKRMTDVVMNDGVVSCGKYTLEHAATLGVIIEYAQNNGLEFMYDVERVNTSKLQREFLLELLDKK